MTPFPPIESLRSYLNALPAGASAGVPDDPVACPLAGWLRDAGFPTAEVAVGCWRPRCGALMEKMPAWAAEFEDALFDATRPGKAITVRRARFLLAEVLRREGVAG